MTDAELNVLTLYLSKDITSLDTLQLQRFDTLLKLKQDELIEEAERRAK